ncbi:MAG: hypothetical protein V1798_04105 [Pseudomonadota bacterium]
MMFRLAKKLIRPGVHGLIVKISRTRVTGENVEDARVAGDYLLKRGYSVTLAYWNRDDDTPAAVISKYEEALEAMRGMAGRAYLSLKSPAFDFDPHLYGGLLARARELDIPLHFDSLGHEFADRTFSLITEHTPPPLQDIGCTLPGRWKRSPADAEKAAALGLAVRVVKGEWPDPEDTLADPRKGFLDVVSQLAGKARSVRIATHDCNLARQSIRMLHQAGTPCDLELLYGFPVRNVLPHVRDMNVPIRLYVPYGHGWVPYCWKHVSRRPGFLWWLLKDSLAGRYQDGFSERDPTSASPVNTPR